MGKSRRRGVLSDPVTTILHIGLYASIPAVWCAIFIRDVASELALATVDLMEVCCATVEGLRAPRAGSGDLDKFAGRVKDTGTRRE